MYYKTLSNTTNTHLALSLFTSTANLMRQTCIRKSRFWHPWGHIDLYVNKDQALKDICLSWHDYWRNVASDQFLMFAHWFLLGTVACSVLRSCRVGGCWVGGWWDNIIEGFSTELSCTVNMLAVAQLKQYAVKHLKIFASQTIQSWICV